MFNVEGGGHWIPLHTTFYVDVSFLYHCHNIYRTWLYIWVKRWVSFKKQELLTLREQPSVHPVFWWVPCCSSCWPIMCLYVLCSVLWSPIRFPHKNDVRFVFTCSCMSYLRYLCFSLHIVASNTYVFLRLVYIMFPVSLDCSFLSSPSVIIMLI